jgi:hypothetical protein
MAYSKEIQKHLDKRNLLAKGTWTAPNKLRLRSIWQEMWFMLPFLAFVSLVTVGFFSAAAAQGALGVLLGFFGGCWAFGVWGAIWHGHLHWKPFYEVLGVHVRFDGPEWYVPPEIMQAFLQEIADKWDEAGVVDFPAVQLLEGSHLYLTEERPVDPLGRIEHERMVGLTYPSKQQSYVYAPYALSHGGAGYELRLQMVHILFPYRSELDDIEWFEENDVL